MHGYLGTSSNIPIPEANIDEDSKLYFIPQTQGVPYDTHEKTMIQFSGLSSNRELILILNYAPIQPNSSEERREDNSYELVLGGDDEHDMSWLSVLDEKRSRKTRLRTVKTPRIVSDEEPMSYWIRLRYRLPGLNKLSIDKSLYLEFGKGLDTENSILSWPVEDRFVLKNVAIKQLPGITVDIR